KLENQDVKENVAFSSNEVPTGSLDNSQAVAPNNEQTSQNDTQQQSYSQNIGQAAEYGSSQQSATALATNSNEVPPYAPAYTLKPIATTFIDEMTIIEGAIISQSNLNIAGEVKGNITCNNNVTTSGKITGDVDCENFVGDKSSIEGNISSKKSLILKNNSTIVGDLSADVIEVSGKINGNIISASELSIFANSAVYGNINAKSIFVEKGSVIQGNVNIKFD
ncbi:MAG: polymer-forming cytoskeletal protein, partial [Oscillospiraceae bacterium]